MDMEKELREAKAKVAKLMEAVEGASEPGELRRLRLELYRAEQVVLNLRRSQPMSRDRDKKRTGRAGVGGTLGGKVTSGTGKYGLDGFASPDAFAYAAWAEAEQNEGLEEAQSAQRHLQQAIVSAALESAVTERQRQMLLMYARGLSMREISEVLGVEKSTVSRTVGRALKNAKKASRSIEAAIKYAADGRERPLSSMLAEVEIFTRKERLAMIAAANRVPIGDIADMLGMDVDSTREILRSGQAKLRGERTQRCNRSGRELNLFLGKKKGSLTMELKKYVNEILDIAKTNDMPWDVGVDMFVANIQNADVPDACYYAGADLDYSAMKPAWMAMDQEERGQAKIDFDAWFRERHDVITAARRAGMRVIPD